MSSFFCKNLKIFLILSIIITMSSCSNKHTGHKLKEITSCNFPDNPSEKAPLWVCNVPIDGFPITGVGSVAKSKAGLQFMTQQAAANARVSIAQELKTNIKNEIQSYIESKNLGDSEVVNNISTSITKQITDASLIGAKILRTISSSNGTLYVLIGINEENYKATLQKALNNAATVNNSKHWISDQQFNNLSQELITN